MSSSKIALFITARLGSKRLPNKHIIDMGGIRPIELLIRRLKKLGFPIVLTTGNEEINKGFIDIASKEGVELFFGNVNNIPLRHLEAANKLNYDFIFSIDGDDLLTAPEGILAIYNKIKHTPFTDGYFYSDGFPFGMNAGGYSKNFLEKAVKSFSGESLETGWGRIFSKDSFVPVTCISTNASNWRLSLDYDEDLEVFTKIWKHFGSSLIDASSEEILKYFADQKIWEFNAHIIEKYWQNFNAEKSQEMARELKK